jgi:hypothetical protein
MRVFPMGLYILAVLVHAGPDIVYIYSNVYIVNILKYPTLSNHILFLHFFCANITIGDQL